MTYGFAFANAHLADTGTPPAWWSSDMWETPDEFVRELESRLGPFDLDPCCCTTTAKAPCYFTEETDGLAQPWFGRVFVNPPYSNIAPWVRKAHRQTATGNAATVACLLPAATDTRWFHDWVRSKADLWFIAGRVRFIGWRGTRIRGPRSASMVAVYTKALTA